jgi:hypothetical protein
LNTDSWIARWGAEQTADYVRDQTVGAALRPAMPTISDAYRARCGARRVWTAARGIGGRDEAAKPPAQIGQELFHTAADRDRAIAHLSTGFRSLANDLAVWQMSNTDRPEATRLAQWIAADVTPTLEEWKAFTAREQKSWWTKIATSWETFEGWWKRLKQLRSLARVHGFSLQSADPTPLPKTIWQHSADGTGSEATAILGVLKIGALTALGIMGAAGLFSAIRNVRARAQITDDRAALRTIVREEITRAG